MARSRTHFVALLLALIPGVVWSAACAGTALGGGIVVSESPAIGEPKPDFVSHFRNRWGDQGDGQALSIEYTRTGEDGLELVIGGSNGFSWEYAVIELVGRPPSKLAALVEVHWFYDGADEEGAWKKPSGWIRVSRSDWSTISAEHPLYVEFQLHEAAWLSSGEVEGFVRVPN